MSEATVVNGFCATCGEPVGEATGTPVEDRKPCPKCGSLARMAKVGIAAKLELHPDLDLKAREQGKGRPFLHQKTGDSYSHKMGKWMRRNQIVDRRNNRYVKRVEDPVTGDVVRDVDKPLTEHRGHGSAKRKQRE